jgi:hypothetical protein
MVDRGKIGFGVLSWRGCDSLANSLASYERQRLLALFDEKVLFLPEARPRGVELARRYGLREKTTPNNLGILASFKALASAMNSPIVLLAENDHPLVEDRQEAERQINIAARYIERGAAQVWRFRHRFILSYIKESRPYKSERYWPRADGAAALDLPGQGLEPRRLDRFHQRRRGQAVSSRHPPDARRRLSRAVSLLSLVQQRVHGPARLLFADDHRRIRGRDPRSARQRFPDDRNRNQSPFPEQRRFLDGGFMTITCDVRAAWRDRIPAVVHIDGSARPQIVDPEPRTLYRPILEAWHSRSGIPALVNASFNVHEEPIVDSPEQALAALEADRVDLLVLNGRIFER